MNIFKKNKKFFSKCKWTILFIKSYIKSSELQKFYARYVVGEAHVESLISQMQKLLKLNPTWILGHFYYSLLAFRKFQYTKHPGSKGAMRVSQQALRMLGAPEYLLSLSSALYEFTLKNFDYVLTELEEVKKNLEVPKELRYVVIEILAATYLVSESKEKALKVLEEIPYRERSQEVQSLVQLIQMGTTTA